MATSEDTSTVLLPRVTIRYCTQCKWMLRAAYFAQELLSTFSVSLGEVALIPSTGGVFTIEITHHTPIAHSLARSPASTLLWDRKTNGGFPEVKHLKQLVRDVIDPDRDLGHVDRHRGGKEQREAREDMESSIQTTTNSKGDNTDLDRNVNATKQPLEDNTGTSATSAGKGDPKNGPEKDRNQKEYCWNCT